MIKHIQDWLAHNKLALVFLIFSGGVTLYPILQTNQPLGSAGLYALMAEVIANGNFAYPQNIPYYGQGSMPFAYPPLSFYLMAGFIKLFPTGEWAYLRFAPWVFSLFTFLAVFLLAKKIGISTEGAALSTVTLAMAAPFYEYQIFSAGVTRSLAYALAAFGLVCLATWLENGRWRWFFASMVLMALTILTHFSYAFFFGFSGAVLVVYYKRLDWRWMLKYSLLAAGAFTLTLSWWLFIMHRHGWDVFQGALFSHNNAEMLFSFQGWMQNARHYFFTLKFTPEITVVMAISLLQLAATRHKPHFFLYVGWMTLIALAVSENIRFLLLIGAVFISHGIAWVEARLRHMGVDWAKPVSYFVFIFAIASSFTLFTSAKIFALNQPLLDMAAWMRENTPADTHYLLVGNSFDYEFEAEWTPLLSQRVSSVGHWGSEWVGTYDVQMENILFLARCKDSYTSHFSLDCVNELVEKRIEPRPTYYVVKHYDIERDAITAPMEVVYQNTLFLVIKTGE